MPNSFPRLLLIDPTPFGGGTATGELKQSFFDDWPSPNLLHLWEKPDHTLAASIYRSGAPQKIEISGDSPDALGKLVESFQPEITMYRPVGDCPTLHQAAMGILRRELSPLVTWMMDDWPSRLREQDQAKFTPIQKDLVEIFRLSKLNYAISERMAAVFAERYGVAFEVARNGVRISDWTLPSADASARRSNVVLRYAGSLAPDTARDSVLEIAKAVERLRGAGVSICFEIRTQRSWFESNRERFESFSGVEMRLATLKPAEYRNWLMDADIVLMAYNFDQSTVRYLNYSFANKLPELLVSGAAMLVYGPREIESVRRLEEEGAALVVSARDDATLDAKLEKLATDSELRVRMGGASRALARREYDLSMQKKTFLRKLTRVAREKLLANYESPESAHYKFDEVQFAANLLINGDFKGVMLDVGAHYGGSLRPFAKNGWAVYAFEPDPKNRKHLDRVARGFETVHVLPFAVSDRLQENVSFYASELSTGISSLSPFHSSHKKSATVTTKTLDWLIEKERLTSVDLLKIDVEGHELDVLNGIDLTHIKPRVVVAEFENNKTQLRGFTVDVLAEKLRQAGYEIYVSEWRPIVEYGGHHQWRRLLKYPCEIDADAWGNLVCLSDRFEQSAIDNAFLMSLDRYAGQFDGHHAPHRRAGLIGRVQVKLRRVAEMILIYHPGLAAVLRWGLRPARPLMRRLLGG